MDNNRVNSKGEIKCTRCLLFKEKVNFKFLHTSWYICSQCNSERRRNKYVENPTMYKGHRSKHYQINKEEIKEKAKIYREENPEKVKETLKRYNLKNPHRKKIRREKDLNFRLRENLRTRVHHAVKGITKKSQKTMDLIGCEIDLLKNHLESLFTEGMSWDNYGEWHIDHIKPCSLFDLTLESNQKECFNFKNLQPLWAKDNLIKNNKYETNNLQD